MHMSVLDQVRGFLRAFRNHRPEPVRRHRGHALARTFKDGTTLNGTGGSLGAGIGVGNNTRREDLLTEASERYDESFGKS